MTEVAVVTDREVMLKLALDAPAAIVTLGGTVAVVISLLDRETRAPNRFPDLLRCGSCFHLRIRQAHRK